MKKIAILLALVMALSCCLLMLAACGDGEESSAPADDSAETSSKEESSVTEETSQPEDSSTTEETSEPEASEPEDSEPEASEPETSEPEKNPDAIPNPDGGNLALGKHYETSQLYQQGGQAVDWGWDDNASIAYPDTDGVELTDGLFPADDASYDDPAFMGFAQGPDSSPTPDYKENGYSYMTIDLEQVYELSKLVLFVGTSKTTAGTVPVSVEFLVSEDGETFTSVGTVNPADDASISYIPVELECNVTGRFVQVRISSAVWMLVTEFEAY